MAHASTAPAKYQLRHVDELRTAPNNNWDDYITAGATRSNFRHVDEYDLMKAHYDEDLESDSEIG